MILFGLLFIVFFFIILIEKPQLIASLIYNFKTVKGVVLNIVYILPFLMIFFNVDELSHWINKKTNGSPNIDTFNNGRYGKWWEDPKKRKNYKTKQLRKVSESTKKIVASNQKWRCFMCHNLLDYSYEIDHNVPLFAGGTNNISNLHALCRNCHGKKTIMEKINHQF